MKMPTYKFDTVEPRTKRPQASNILRSPFDMFVNLDKNDEWWAIVDSNHRPLRCQRNALTN